MLTERGFDHWAEAYDASVGQSDEAGSYPFAGYRKIVNAIVGRVLEKEHPTVLDIGFGTGVLTARLYQAGCATFGQDFSAEMIAIARERMPEAKLFQGDFTQGLVPELAIRDYDFILATYSLHHLRDREKVCFLRTLQAHLRPGGEILIGDVAFATRPELEACRVAAGADWDDEEFYFVAEELRQELPQLQFHRMSPCAGILTLRKDNI